MDAGHTIKIAVKKVHKNLNQTKALEQAFAIDPHPNKLCITKLAKETMLSEQQVRKWFYWKKSKESLKQWVSTPFARE